MEAEQHQDLRRAKRIMQQAVKEAETAVQAALPSLDELATIREAFDDSVGRAERIMKALSHDFQAPAKPTEAIARH